MKKHIMVLVFLSLLVTAFAGVAQAWQGRMDGMGDPYGLMPDESDFIIHPSIKDRQWRRGEVLRLLPLHLYRCDGLG